MTAFWTHAPPEPSERSRWWIARFAKGWRRNRRIGSMGYHEASEHFGVYIWEYVHILQPLLIEVATCE